MSAVFGDFLSFPGKIRAGLGAVGLFKAPPPSKEESVKEFISRNLGEEVFYRLIEPFCSGVYAGDPEKLSMKAAFGRIQILEEKGGSLVGGALKLMEERKANPPPPRPEKLPPKPAGQTVGSFREGLQMLPSAIAGKLEGKIQCKWKLSGLEKRDDGVYALTYDTPEGTKVVFTRSVGLTAPAYVVADLLGEQAPALRDALASIDYPPVCAVTLAYPESAVKVSEDTSFTSLLLWDLRTAIQ
jgi:protoporphyrinogen/coproporphyrinogen III oxidase